MLKPGIYKHYKNPDHEYIILGEGMYENTEELVVIYQAQYGEKQIFVRPLDQFEETVSWNGEQVPRFKFIRDK